MRREHNRKSFRGVYPPEKFRIWSDEHVEITVVFTEERESRIITVLKDHDSMDDVLIMS